MDHFRLRHSMSLRMPLSVYEWIRAQSNAAGLPPASYAIKRLQELAQDDLRQGEVDGDLRVVAGD